MGEELGLSPEDYRRAFSQAGGSDEPAPSPVPGPERPNPERSAHGPVWRLSSQAFSGFYEGLAEMLDVPGDLVQAGLKAAGVEFDEDSFFMSEGGIKKFLSTVGLIGPDAEGVIENLVRRTGKEVGAVLPLMTGIGTAARLGVVGKNALTRSVFGRARQAPGAFAAEEVAGAASAGFLAQGAHEAVAPLTDDTDLEGLAENTGLAVGGFLPSGLVGAGKFIARGGPAKVVNAAIHGVDDAELRGLATQRAANEVQGRVADPRVTDARMARGARVDDAVPGMRSTSAQQSLEPGLADLEISMGGTSPVVNENLRVQRQANNQSLMTYMERTAPTGDATRPGRVLVERAARLRTSLENRIHAGLSAIDGQIGKTMTPAQASIAQKEYLAVAAKEARDQARVLYDVVDPSGTAKFSTARIHEAAESIATPPRMEAPADSLGDLTDAIKELPADAPFNELRSLRSRLNQEIRTERAVPAPNRNRIRKLGVLRDAVEDTLNAPSSLSNLDPEVAERLRAANAAYREYAEVFKAPNVAKVLREGPRAVPDSAVLDYFINARRGSREAASELSTAIGGNVEARQAVSDYAVRQAHKFAFNPRTGQLDSRKLNKWVQNNSEALREFPEARAEVANLGRLQRRVDVLGLAGERSNAIFQRRAAALFMDDDPHGAVNAVLGSPHQTRDAARLWRMTKGDADAQQGLRRALWDEFVLRSAGGEIDGVGTPFRDPTSMRRFINQNEDVFRAWGYTDADIDNLRLTADAAERISLTRAPARVNPGEPGSALKVLTLPAILSRLYGIQRGVVGPQFVATEIGARFMNAVVDKMTERQVQAILEDAITNPRLMRDLMAMDTGGRKAVVAFRRVHAHFVSSGILQTHQRGVITTPRLEFPDQGAAAESGLEVGAP